MNSRSIKWQGVNTMICITLSLSILTISCSHKLNTNKKLLTVIDSFLCDSLKIQRINTDLEPSLLYEHNAKECFIDKIINGDRQAINFLHDHLQDCLVLMTSGNTAWYKNTYSSLFRIKLRGVKLISVWHKIIENSFYCNEEEEGSFCQYNHYIGFIYESTKVKDPNLNLTKKLNEIYNKHVHTSHYDCLCQPEKEQYKYLLKELENGNLIYKSFGEE